MPQARTLQFTTDTGEALRQIQTHFDSPIASGVVTAGAEDGSSKRRITVQVVDRLKRPWQARWLVWVFLATSPTGAPSGSGNTVAFVSGDVLMTTVVNGMWLVMADADGRIVFDVTVAGVASRYVGTQPDAGIPVVSSAVVWA